MWNSPVILSLFFFPTQDHSIDRTHRLAPNEVLSGRTNACGWLDDLDGLVGCITSWVGSAFCQLLQSKTNPDMS